MSLATWEIKDNSLRAAYRKAVSTSSAGGSTITAKELATLIKSTFDFDQISAEEEQDLKNILRNADLTPRARAELDEFLKNRAAMDAKGVFPMTASETRMVADTVGATFNSGHITFQDPVQMYRYNSHMYTDIARLIRIGFITCWWHDSVADEDGKTYRGLYNTHKNRLTIAMSKRLGVHRQSTMVHEATHAIQDMGDMTLGIQHAEAAAHLAQAVMLVNRGGGTGNLLFDRVANMEAQAKKVLKGQPITVADWNVCINAIKTAYPSNGPIDFKGDGGGTSKAWEEIVKFLFTVSW